MTVDVRLTGLEGRALVVGQPGRVPFTRPYVASVESLNQSMTLSRDELVASPREKAVALARELFLRFGWKASPEQLADHQRELTEQS